MTNEEQNNISYHEEAGVVYLAFLPHLSLATTKQYPESLDLITLEIKHFKDWLSYKEPEGNEQLHRVAELLDNLYDNLRTPNSLKNPKLKKMDVVISGEKIILSIDKSYQLDEILYINVGFPGYPFRILELETKVTGSAYEEGKNKVELTFNNIPEVHRDIIIRFVNHLQRNNIKKTKNA